MDAIASPFRPGSLARAFQSFRHEAGGTDAGGGFRRRSAEGLGASKGLAHCRDCDKDDARKPDRASAPQSAAMAALSYRRAESTSLFIQTRDGDTVELKIRSREATSLAAAQWQDGDQTASAVQQRSLSSTRMSFEVKGELSAEELAAIRDVVEQADALAGQFFDNDVAGAFAAAERLHMDGSQLASVAFSASLREQLTYTEKSSSRPASAPLATSGEPLGPPSARDVAPASAEAASGPVAAPTVDSAPPATIPVQLPDSLAPPPAATPGASPTADPLTSIRQFLTNLLDQLSAPGPSEAASLDLSLKIRIFQSVVTTAAAAQPAAGDSAEPLPALVPETLDALAAPQDPPLRALA